MAIPTCLAFFVGSSVNFGANGQRMIRALPLLPRSPRNPRTPRFSSLDFLTPLMISANVQTNASPTLSEWWGVEAKHNGGAGVRGFCGLRGHSIDRDNFPPKCRMNLFLGVGGYRSRFLNHRNDPPINTATHKNQASNSVPLAQASAGGSRLTLPFNATSRHDPSSDNDRLLKALINE